jgi:hypothetical protein
MSARFIELTHPCKECLVRAACEHLKRKEGSLKLNEFHANILCLQADNFAKAHSHRKDLIEAWIEFGIKLFTNLKNETAENNFVLLPLLLENLKLLKYIIDSKSWRDNTKLQPHDFEECRNLINKVRYMLE